MQTSKARVRAWMGVATATLIAMPAAGRAGGQAQGATTAAPATAPAAPVIYPAKGQTQETMQKDKGECNTWAKEQTGYDPAAAAQQAQGQPDAGAKTSGGAVKGGAKGAAAGAAVGAIAGDPGKGAAIGAAAGGAGGARKKKKQEAAQQQAAAQEQAASNEKLTTYGKAFGACMEGRGYSVK